ncbi:MAG: HEAT repeat domain-containing protein [Chloroflexi bacterium]|nr:HEAT repeat domain-containing protein [Chloroflexota bacterium]
MNSCQICHARRLTAFKSDEDFLRYLTMGAVGSAGVTEDLNRHGHRIIELERSTTSNKIWSQKIKRLRLPDLLCIRCGLRVEARGKSALQIKVSDTPTNPERRWSAGLDDDDLFGFLQVYFDGDTPVAGSSVEYFRVSDLRLTEHLSRLGPPKSAREGAERDRCWPAHVPSYDGTVIAVDATHFTMKSRSGALRHQRIPSEHVPYVLPGEDFRAGQRFVSGVVPKPSTVSCPGDCWDPVAQLRSMRSGISLTTAGRQYAAVKALALHTDAAAATTALLDTWQDISADYRVRLEALGGLAGRLQGPWIAALGRQVLEAPSADMQMEAVLILSEQASAEASEELATILAQRDLPQEVRAAAAWGLGICGHGSPHLLLEYLDDPSDTVALHSLVAMGSDFSEGLLQRAARLLPRNDRAAAAAVHLISRHRDGSRAATLLLRCLNEAATNRLAGWALYGLALLDGVDVRGALSGSPDPSIAHQIERISVGLTSDWLLNERASTPSAIRFLSRQTVCRAPQLEG